MDNTSILIFAVLGIMLILIGVTSLSKLWSGVFVPIVEQPGQHWEEISAMSRCDVRRGV
jgi:hypothetical protein